MRMQDFSEEIDSALDVLFKLNKKSCTKNALFDKGRIVYLQVILFKIPFGPPRKRKFLKLRHSLYGNEPEVCLFVPNRKTGVEYKKTTDELIDYCVDYYTELLEKHEVKGVSTVMPLKQLRSEYGTYELKKKLVHRFDLFLCKNSLLYNQRFLTSLGKTFRIANKEPLGVIFPKSNVDFDPEFQKNINKAMLTSHFYISRFSDNYSIPIGSLSHSKEELKENLELVLNQIFTEKVIPGGLKNIRAMNLWPSQSKSVPLYVSTELPNGMKKPKVKTRRKRRRGVEGELSTQPGKKVCVMPNGEVFVTNIKRSIAEPEMSNSEDEDSFVDESGEDEDYAEKEKTKGNLKRNAKRSVKNEDSESENDEEIEEKEVKLMKDKMETEFNFNREIENQQKDKNEREKNANRKKSKRIKFSQNSSNRSRNEEPMSQEKKKFKQIKRNGEDSKLTSEKKFIKKKTTKKA